MSQPKFTRLTYPIYIRNWEDVLYGHVDNWDTFIIGFTNGSTITITGQEKVLELINIFDRYIHREE